MGHILKCHDIVKTDFVRAENCYVYDEDGRRYIDLESGIWCTALGHSQPRLNQVIAAQAATLMHLGTRYPNAGVEAAALALLDVVQIGEGKCAFLSSGSEAVEFGAQAMRRVSGKDVLLTFSNAYLAAYGSAGRKQAGEWYLVDWNANPDPAQTVAQIPFEQIGGFVLEPGGSGSGFVRFPPQALVQELAEKVKQAGGLVMSNEVTTGMGRTGKWFGFQHYAIQPDIVAVGKGLGNGYPVSAVVMREETAEKLEATGIRYAQSHQNDPLGCSVAKEVIAIMQEDNLIERGAKLGTYFLTGLQRLAEKHAIVKEARGRGMLLGLELQAQENLSVDMLYHRLLEQGFLVGYYPAGRVLRLDPALTIEPELIDEFLVCLDSILVHAKEPPSR
jgi:acetylornithine aminotransferase